MTKTINHLLGRQKKKKIIVGGLLAICAGKEKNEACSRYFGVDIYGDVVIVGAALPEGIISDFLVADACAMHCWEQRFLAYREKQEV